mmetsp:Transcript_25081/g.54566  ORF Transcript_25081/g.54566 Transcript_25081/m.54566 type:complete len:429 (-) Transcript_25081:233-1519(-)|eukprot:CAMPEP_0118934636 /NCGR_PEP_ID=MMETSP1169-20130426/13932_1 /TAXON_ID=36882 /ORGANISM="Pyramimonas obovata, Strain CCMP722" /LENGTH=428 /DNA_ID=CAMNT_0006877561 /DNA_START=646 /DNA_END=1932 /DNA_ORIENTATION=+
MLTIQRVPTVMLLEQMANSTDDLKNAEGAGNKLMNAASLPGAILPLYKCSHRSPRNTMRKRTRSFGDLQTVPDILDYLSNDSGSDSVDSGSEDSLDDSLNTKSLFDTVLLGQWDKLNTEGMFRYDVTECSTKMIPGKFGFVAQLNEGRATKKRPTEFRVDLVKQAFDHGKFNFTKAAQKEALFQFDTSADAGATYLRTAKVLDDSPNLLVINVSPIEYGHILLVPRVLDHLPQQIQPDTLLTAIEMVAESANPFFRAGYNSLGAYATINHLHFQAYYLMAPFPIERAATSRVGKRRKHTVSVSRLTDYPVRALVFETSSSLQDLAYVCGEACIKLQDANIAFNLLIVEGGARVFLIPQCYAEKQARGLVQEKYLETQVNPACWEICGHMVLKRQEDYDNFTESFTCDFLSQVSLTEEKFQAVMKMIEV